MAVEHRKRSKNIVALSEELGVHRRLLYKWRDQFDPVDIGDEPPPENPRESQQPWAGKAFFDRCLRLARYLNAWIFSRTLTTGARILLTQVNPFEVPGNVFDLPALIAANLFAFDTAARTDSSALNS
jgi:hypothetical protein